MATGEGADELFWGYDLFKEVALRELPRRDPDARRSVCSTSSTRTSTASRRRARARLGDASSSTPARPTTRCSRTRRASRRRRGVKALLRRATPRSSTAAATASAACATSLPRGVRRWSALERAALPRADDAAGPYLLAAQGDRVAMAHGVEGRYPFLDHRVFAHSVASAARAQARQGLRDKVGAARRSPRDGAAARHRRARRSSPTGRPRSAPFFEREPAGVGRRAALARALRAASASSTERTVAGLLRRCRAGRATGFREGMALVGVLSTQVWHERVLRPARRRLPAESASRGCGIDRTVEALERV